MRFHTYESRVSICGALECPYSDGSPSRVLIDRISQRAYLKEWIDEKNGGCHEHSKINGIFHVVYHHKRGLTGHHRHNGHLWF